MKLITAVVLAEELSALRVALTQRGITGLTAFDVKAFACSERQGRGTAYLRYAEASEPMVMLELAVDEAHVAAVLDVITNYAGSGVERLGMLFVRDLDQTVRIRTGEAGALAV